MYVLHVKLTGRRPYDNCSTLQMSNSGIQGRLLYGTKERPLPSYAAILGSYKLQTDMATNPDNTYIGGRAVINSWGFPTTSYSNAKCEFVIGVNINLQVPKFLKN